ncbi:nucleolus and neural progenitor protein [Willisornis vidua]|uniref:Nucleolus and neural progenitor protein n=1 Tax=Willisornis vidua TaxID=1566151 RepID=A0ABQ9DSE1_9PASS|nr:nucleolus and neural progenitor protein [Willisornis vidua]
MAAPRAAWAGLDVPWNRGDAPWNRLDVPWPTSNATVALAAAHPAVAQLSALRRHCDTAGRQLSGPGLAAEGRVLRAVLHVYHSRLLRHRPYLALKQVEQCLKRLWKMNLVGCLGTLVELIPKIQYRCVLQTLMSLYDVLSTMLHLVSETQQMPYIKGFTFPSDINNFLGVNLSSELKKQKAKMLTTKKSASWLKKLFPTMPAVPDVGKQRNFVTSTSAMTNHNIPCPMDIGETVLVPRASRGKHLEFDVKSLLKPSRHPTQEGINIATTPFKAKLAPPSSRIAKSQHAASLVHMVQTAASFGELSEALRKAILWCKNNKFKSAAYFLRNKLLKSNRLHHVEAQGCSLKKKLRCVQASVRKYLLYGSQRTQWPKQYLWAQLCPRRIKSSTCLKKALKTVQQKPSELSGLCETSASLIIPADQDAPPSEEERSDAAHVRLSTAGTPKQLLLQGSPGPVWKESTENTDIDSIFAAIGV